MPRKVASKAAAAAKKPEKDITAVTAAITGEQQKPEHPPHFIPAVAKAATAPEEQPEGVAFINNFVNREFIISPNRKYKFKDTRETFTDPELIAFFSALAEEGKSQVFKVQ